MAKFMDAERSPRMRDPHQSLNSHLLAILGFLQDLPDIILKNPIKVGRKISQAPSDFRLCHLVCYGSAFEELVVDTLSSYIRGFSTFSPRLTRTCLVRLLTYLKGYRPVVCHRLIRGYLRYRQFRNTEPPDVCFTCCHMYSRCISETSLNVLRMRPAFNDKLEPGNFQTFQYIKYAFSMPFTITFVKSIDNNEATPKDGLYFYA